jgi:hypothetical protein
MCNGGAWATVLQPPSRIHRRDRLLALRRPFPRIGRHACNRRAIDPRFCNELLPSRWRQRRRDLARRLVRGTAPLSRMNSREHGRLEPGRRHLHAERRTDPQGGVSEPGKDVGARRGAPLGRCRAPLVRRRRGALNWAAILRRAGSVGWVLEREGHLAARNGPARCARDRDHGRKNGDRAAVGLAARRASGRGATRRAPGRRPRARRARSRIRAFRRRCGDASGDEAGDRREGKDCKVDGRACSQSHTSPQCNRGAGDASSDEPADSRWPTRPTPGVAIRRCAIGPAGRGAA